MSLPDELRWTSVYGATVAAQVRERFAQGRGGANDAAMDGFVEEAEAVADLAEEAWKRSHPKGERES